MGLSVVVVTFNSAACVATCLSSVRRFLPRAEIVGVDNASEDDTVDVLSSFPDVQLVRSAENLGFGRACNLGAEAAAGTHVLFLNPDVVLTGADEEQLGRLIARDPFGLAAPQLVSGEGARKTSEGGRAESHWLRDYAAHTWLTLWPRELPLPGGGQTNGNVDWVSGALLIARTSEFRRLGGFDPRFFLYYEDRDLCARYRREGLPITTTTAIAGRHERGTSSGEGRLVVEPLAWSLLGWLEYVSVHDSENAARRAARTTLTTLRVLEASLRVTRHGTPRGGRVDRRSRELGELLASLRRKVDGGDSPEYYPNARRILADAFPASVARS